MCCMLPHLPPLPLLQEMDALLKIARLGYWRFEAGEVSDVMWALANARHWTPRLAEVEQVGMQELAGLCDRLSCRLPLLPSRPVLLPTAAANRC